MDQILEKNILSGLTQEVDYLNRSVSFKHIFKLIVKISLPKTQNPNLQVQIVFYQTLMEEMPLISHENRRGGRTSQLTL